MKAGGLHRRPPWLGESQGQARQAKHCFRTMGEPGHSTINRQKKKKKRRRVVWSTLKNTKTQKAIILGSRSGPYPSVFDSPQKFPTPSDTPMIGWLFYYLALVCFLVAAVKDGSAS